MSAFKTKLKKMLWLLPTTFLTIQNFYSKTLISFKYSNQTNQPNLVYLKKLYKLVLRTIMCYSKLLLKFHRWNLTKNKKAVLLILTHLIYTNSLNRKLSLKFSTKGSSLTFKTTSKARLYLQASMKYLILHSHWRCCITTNN